MSSYFHSPKYLTCYFPLGTMFLVLCILQFMFYMTCGCIDEEKIALIRIRSSLVDANSKVPASWVHNDDCCSWERIRCNGNSKRVSDIYLSSIYEPQATSLSVSSDASGWNLNLIVFSSFHELQLLDLSWNSAYLQNFHGLQGLPKLRYLNLSDNNFIGYNNLGSFSTLVSLEVINLANNNISASLQDIDFRNIKNLRELHLGSNQLSGSIPASLFELPHLEYVDLSGNLLHGHVPVNSSVNLTSLQTLKLSANNLNGTFDFFWLRNCTMLRKIDLSGNTGLAVDVKFRGRVPPFQLKELMLSGCNLDKSIIAGPNFLGTQRQLQILDLSNNNLTGSMPNWIFTNVATLVYLDLSNNSLVGSLDLWQRPSNLQMINISTNYFVGHLPLNISSVLPDVEVLDASNNIISGGLPPSLCNISSMLFVDLSNNEFTGKVPTCFFTDFHTLQLLKLSNNKLGGSIFGGASNLSVEAIYLDSNQFEGTLPSNMSGPTKIMDLHDNRLSGKFNSSFWNFSSLEVLNVASNRLSGVISSTVCKLTALQFLDMSENNFSGFMPNCTSKLTVIFLNMSGNSLAGFPSGIFNSSYVTALDLRYNHFTGSLDWTRHLSEIRLLLLGGNGFEGHISPNLCHLHYLNIIDFSHNKLSGPLPPCIGGISFGYHVDDLLFVSSVSEYAFGTGYSNMDNDDPSFVFYARYDLQSFTFSTKGGLYTYGRKLFDLMFGIDLSANMLSGEIPWEIGNLSHIKSLNLSHNFFAGRIPDTFSNMSAIESLDLSHNELSGQIPWELTRLWSLGVFSVAYNNLSGCIPSSGQFASFGMDSYQGNENLRNVSLGNGCSPGSGPVAPALNFVGGRTSDETILYVVSAASFVFAFWATIAFSFYHPYGQSVVLKL